MSVLPWRILVITHLGADSGKPASVSANTANAWFDSLALPTTLSALAPAHQLAAGAAGSALDAFLHEPARQRIEAASRGLALLLAHAGEAVRVEIMSVPEGALVERFREAAHAAGQSGQPPLTLVVLDRDFTHKAADLGTLGALAGIAAEVQVPIVANAGAGFFDLRFLVQAAAVQDIAKRLVDSAHSGWQAFQQSEDARWVCLTLNRFLLREPWKLEAYSETCAESNPESYLWGRGIWLVAAAVARSVRAHGHALDISGTGGRFDGLPTRAFPVISNETKALATEVPFTDTQSLELTHAAFTPLTGGLDRPSVLLSMVVTAHRYGTSRLTVEGTLGYQLTAARLALVCGDAADSTDTSGAGGQVAESLRLKLSGEFAGMLGDKGEGLTVEVLEADADIDVPRRAAVTLRPALILEGKSPELRVEIALEG